jgi:hypothetical protein
LSGLSGGPVSTGSGLPGTPGCAWPVDGRIAAKVITHAVVSRRVRVIAS